MRHYFLLFVLFVITEQSLAQRQIIDSLKSFGMTNMLIESELDNLEKKYDFKLREETSCTQETTEIEQTYFPQFDMELRQEAAYMAKNYEIFYCLEKTIRKQAVLAHQPRL